MVILIDNPAKIDVLLKADLIGLATGCYLTSGITTAKPYRSLYFDPL